MAGETKPGETKEGGTKEGGLSSTHMIIALVVAILLGLAPIVLLFKCDYEHPVLRSYVGAESCGECHQAEFESWARTRMANSFEVLRAGVAGGPKKLAGLDPARDYTHDEECLPCHTTGYGKMGGFVSIEETPQMAGVTCESCHGAGGGYAEGIMGESDGFSTEDARTGGLVYPPTEAVCRGCHNERSPFVGQGYAFSFTERVDLGTHAHYELNYDHAPVPAATSAPPATAAPTAGPAPPTK